MPSSFERSLAVRYPFLINDGMTENTKLLVLKFVLKMRKTLTKAKEIARAKINLDPRKEFKPGQVLATVH